MNNRAYSLIEIKSVNEDERIITGIATTPHPDHHDDVVESEGAEFSLPIPLLWMHDAAAPIGHVTAARVSRDGIHIVAKIAKVADAGRLRDRLEEAWQSLRSGLVRGLSIGFKSLEDEPLGNGRGRRFLRWTWLELSAVVIAANANASITNIKSADALTLARPASQEKTTMRAAVSIANQNVIPGSDMARVAKFLLAAGGDRMHAREIAASQGASERVTKMLQKTAVGAGHMSDGDFGEVLGDWQIGTAAFFTSLKTASVFFRLLDSGFKRIPLRTRVGVVSSTATAYIRGEGSAIPIAKLTLGSQNMDLVTAAAILILTKEVVRSNDPAATSIVNSELRSAIAEVVDTHFFDLMSDTGMPSTVSAGDDAEAMREDLRFLLNSTNTTGAGQLFFAMSPDVANRASLIDDGRGAMTPLGGLMLGLPALVSNTIPAGTIRVINASAIGANSGDVELDVSESGTVQMADNPTNSAAVPTATELVSLFQTNSIGMLARVSFAAEKTRDDAMSEVTGVTWGGNGT